MAKRPEVGPPDKPEEIEAYFELLGDDPDSPGLGARELRSPLVEETNIRVLRHGREVVGGLVQLPMSQYFGGRAVPVAALTGLCAQPGGAQRLGLLKLLKGCLAELQDRRFALAIIHPTLHSPLREVGFEQAGARHEVRVATRDIDVEDRSVALRRIEKDDVSQVIRTYRTHAATLNGHLERHRLLWDRIQNPEPGPVQAYLVETPTGIEGYCYVHQQPRRDGAGYDLRVTDKVALTARAGRRLLTFFKDSRSLANRVVWRGSPQDALTAMFPEPIHEVRLLNYWMLRPVEVGTALCRRGYPAAVSGTLHMWVRDTLLPENSGAFMLHVGNGEGSLEAGGRGSLRMDIRGLAALYSGHRTPGTLRAAGLLEGDDAELELAATLFASGAAPHHPDVL